MSETISCDEKPLEPSKCLLGYDLRTRMNKGWGERFDQGIYGKFEILEQEGLLFVPVRKITEFLEEEAGLRGVELSSVCDGSLVFVMDSSLGRYAAVLGGPILAEGVYINLENNLEGVHPDRLEKVVHSLGGGPSVGYNGWVVLVPYLEGEQVKFKVQPFGGTICAANIQKILECRGIEYDKPVEVPLFQQLRESTTEERSFVPLGEVSRILHEKAEAEGGYEHICDGSLLFVLNGFDGLGFRVCTGEPRDLSGGLGLVELNEIPDTVHVLSCQVGGWNALRILFVPRLIEDGEVVFEVFAECTDYIIEGEILRAKFMKALGRQHVSPMDRIGFFPC